jgi:ribosomal protein L11 methyltransferase
MLPDVLAEGQFAVVVANILSNPLKVLAPMLSGRVRSGGSLVLSGVLERQAQEVAQAYAPWLPLAVWQARDGWVCLAGTKP